MKRLAGKRSGLVVPHRPTLLHRLVARLVWAAIWTLESTQRFRVHDPHRVLETVDQQPVIFAIWHNRLAFSLTIHRRFVRRRAGRRLAALVSASRDGALLAAILEAFDVEPIRGSSSRRGPQALLELTSWARRGLDLAITPDGPRGPRYIVQPGIVALARVTGRSIVPVAYNVRRKIQFSSWDRFQLPLPFGRCELELGPLVDVPAREDTDLEEVRRTLESHLVAITRD